MEIITEKLKSQPSEYVLYGSFFKTFLNVGLLQEYISVAVMI